MTSRVLCMPVEQMKLQPFKTGFCKSCGVLVGMTAGTYWDVKQDLEARGFLFDIEMWCTVCGEREMDSVPQPLGKRQLVEMNDYMKGYSE